MVLSALIRGLKRGLLKVFKRVPGRDSKLRKLIGAWAKNEAAHLKASFCLMKVAIKLSLYFGAIVLCFNEVREVAYKQLWANSHLRFLALIIIAVLSIEMYSIGQDIVEAIQDHIKEGRDKEIGPFLVGAWIVFFVIFIHGSVIYLLSSFRP